ncbi:MAG: hypothetical protein ACREQW_09425 [Candidatus Binatia bacterium]
MRQADLIPYFNYVVNEILQLHETALRSAWEYSNPAVAPARISRNALAHVIARPRAYKSYALPAVLPTIMVQVFP